MLDGGTVCTFIQFQFSIWSLLASFGVASCGCRVKWANLERPCKGSVNGKLQVKFSVCNVLVNRAFSGGK